MEAPVAVSVTWLQLVSFDDVHTAAFDAAAAAANGMSCHVFDFAVDEMILFEKFLSSAHCCNIHCVSEKTPMQTFVRISAKYKPIFKISARLESAVNLH